MLPLKPLVKCVPPTVPADPPFSYDYLPVQKDGPRITSQLERSLSSLIPLNKRVQCSSHVRFQRAGGGIVKERHLFVAIMFSMERILVSSEKPLQLSPEIKLW